MEELFAAPAFSTVQLTEVCGSLNVVEAAGAGAHVTTSHGFIEAPLVTDVDAGAVVTLLNWGDKNFTESQPLSVSVAGLGWKPSKVELADAGPVAFKVSGDVVQVQVPLQAADFLVLRK